MEEYYAYSCTHPDMPSILFATWC